MPKEAINIKGTKQGLIIMLDPELEFDEIKTGLQRKMDASRGFFKGAKFALHDEKKLVLNEKAELESICRQYGLIPNPDVCWPPDKRRATVKHQPPELSQASPLPGENALLVKRTLRSGQVLSHHGNITLIGDIHPGAQLIAGGNIIVMGTCAGFIHAGNTGDSSAYILALSIVRGCQIRIADQFLQEIEDNLPSNSIIEARIQHNQIVFSLQNK